MPSPYRPRPIAIKHCEQCGVSFESRHQRTRFCCNSCRAQAFHVRHGRQLRETESEGVELNFSWQNLGVLATAVGGVDLAKHLLTQSDQQQESVTELTQAVRRLSLQISLLETNEDRARIEAGEKALERQEALAIIAGR